MEEKTASGRCRHEIKTIDRVCGREYATKYVVDLKVESDITEIRIYAGEDGVMCTPCSAAAT